MSKRLLVILAVIAAGFLGLAVFVKSPSPRQSSAVLTAMVGKTAPDFNLPDQTGQTVSLNSLRGKKVVLFFNEGITCYPACWNQMAALATDAALNGSGVVSLSVVVDKPSQWTEAFKQMPDLAKGRILFDTSKEVSGRYGVLSLPSSMHRGMAPGHTYVLIDQKGIVRDIKDNPPMTVINDQIKKDLEKM